MQRKAPAINRQACTSTHQYYNPGRAINGRACPRTVQLDDETIGVVFYDIDKDQEGGPGLFFLRIPMAKLAAREHRLATDA